MAVTTLASQTHETLSKIHETIVSFTTDTSKRDARLEELEQDCQKHIHKLETAFAEESSALNQKRKAEKDAIAELRKKEDEERERKRRLEDEEMEMKAKTEDEERKKALEMEKVEVKDTTESLKAQAEAQLEEETQRRWGERNARLKELREEINRLIEEQLQMPLPLPKRKSLWTAETSPRYMPMITSPASTPPVAVESKTSETLPVAAVETQPMSNPIVKANDDESLPAAEKNAVSIRDIDMDSESSLETLPRTTYSPDPVELSFTVPPVKISLATDTDKKEEGDRAVAKDENNALGFVSRSSPPNLDVDEDEAIAHMSELRRVNSRDPSAERHAQLGADAGAGDHDATDSESEHDELAWWEQQQRKSLESGGDVFGQVPEKKEEQLAAKIELPRPEVLERAPTLPEDWRRSCVVDEKPLAATEGLAESSERSSSAGEMPAVVTQDLESPKATAVVAEEESLPTREINSNTTEAVRVPDTKSTEHVLDAWGDVEGNGHTDEPDVHAQSESEAESESNPEPKPQGDTGSFSPRPSGGDWPLKHDGTNIDEPRDVSRNATPELKLDTDMFNKEPQVALVDKDDVDLGQAQAQAAVDSMVSPTSTVERGFQTTSVATPISHIELMSKKVHDELDMVESSPVDVISMGSPFERGSSRSRSFDASHDQDHENSQLTADTSVADTDTRPRHVDHEAKAAFDIGSDQMPEAGDKAAGEWAVRDEPQIEPAKTIADGFDHSDGASKPLSVSAEGADDPFTQDLESTQKAPVAAADDDTDGGKPDSVSPGERTEGLPTFEAAKPTERVAADVSDHDDVSEASSVSGDMQVDAQSAREDPKPTERALFGAAERSDVNPVNDDDDAHGDDNSKSGWTSEGDGPDRTKAVSKSLSEELAEDDSSEDPETLYDDDPLAVRSPETVKAEPAVQAAVAKTLPQQQLGDKDVEEVVSSLPHEQLSDEATSKDQRKEEDDRVSVPGGEDKEKSSKPLSLSEELAHQEHEAYGDYMDYTDSDWDEDQAKDDDLDPDRRNKEAAVDIKADTRSDASAPSAMPSTEKDAAPGVEVDVQVKTVAALATVTKEEETVPGVEVDTKAETVAPAASSSAEKDAAAEVDVFDRTGTVAHLPEAPTQHAEEHEVADVVADKPETLETQPPVPTQEQTASTDGDVKPVGESNALRPEQVLLPAKDDDLYSVASDSEHEDEGFNSEADEETAKAVRHVEAAQKPQVLKDISTGDNLQPPATGFTDAESQEFFTPMASAGLRSPPADEAFFGKDSVDQGNKEAAPRGTENRAETVELKETTASPPEQTVEEMSAHRTSLLSQDHVEVNKADREIKADANFDDERDIPAMQESPTPTDARRVSTGGRSDNGQDLDLDPYDHDNVTGEEAALNKVPTNETHSTNQTNEQDSNNGYASSQHELELEDGYSATVHGQDHLFDSDEHNSAGDHDDEQDSDSLDEQDDKDAMPVDDVRNPFRDSAGEDDLDDGPVQDSGDGDGVPHDGFEVRANLSVVEKSAAPESVTAASQDYSGDVLVSDVDDSDDDEVRHDNFGAREESPDPQPDVQTNVQDQDQDDRDASVAPETVPADDHTSSESKIDSTLEETDATVETQQPDQQASVVASSLPRNIDDHDFEDDANSDYGEDGAVSEQHVSETTAPASNTELDKGSYDMGAQQAALPEPVSPTATRGLAASRHNPEREQATERPQTPEASISIPQNPFEGHDDADFDMENFAPRDVTNISLSSQATGSSQADMDTPQTQPQSRSRRDTDVESTPMSLRSASTLSSAPSSPVHASLLTDNHEPVIRDSWPSHPAHGGHAGESSISSRFPGFLSGSSSGRPRGDSHLSNVSTSDDLTQDVNLGGAKGSGNTFPLGPSPMRLWQRRDQGLADNTDSAYHRPVSAIDIGTGVNSRDESDTITPTAASASATTATYRNSITGAGYNPPSGSSASTGPSLFQRMRSVFENNSSASASAAGTTPTTVGGGGGAGGAGGSRSNSPVVRSRPGSFYRSLEQHQQEQLAAKRLSGSGSGGLVRPGDVAAAYDRGHAHGHDRGGSYDDGGEGVGGSTCGYDEVAGYLHHEHTTNTKTSSRRREGHRRDEYYDDDSQSGDDSGEDASLLVEHGSAGGEYSGHGYGYDRHGRLTSAN